MTDKENFIDLAAIAIAAQLAPQLENAKTPDYNKVANMAWQLALALQNTKPVMTVEAVMTEMTPVGA